MMLTLIAPFCKESLGKIPVGQRLSPFGITVMASLFETASEEAFMDMFSSLSWLVIILEEDEAAAALLLALGVHSLFFFACMDE
jgi:hypothetical protein